MKAIILPFDRKYIFVAVCLIFVAALSLLLMGRAPWYKYGPPGLWSGNVSSNQNSQQLADPYTFSHLIHGFIIYFLLWLVFGEKIPLGLRFALAVGLECGWEVIENTNFVINRYREATISLDYYGDSVLNSIGDILACVIGFIAAAKLPPWATIALAILLEIILALWIRDGLLLNIIMLIYPIPAIRAWQMGI